MFVYPLLFLMVYVPFLVLIIAIIRYLNRH